MAAWQGQRAERHEPEEIEWCSEVEIKRESSICSFSIVVSEREYREEPNTGGNERGTVIFQQCGAQNFNGLSRVREGRSGERRGLGPKRRNMRARERDNVTGEWGPDRERNKPAYKHEPRRVSLASLSRVPSFLPPESFIIDTADYSRAGGTLYILYLLLPSLSPLERLFFPKNTLINVTK